MADAVVIAARRTPIARLDGDLAHLDAQALAAIAIRSVVDELEGPEPDDVILACAAGPGGNLARRAALDAGLAPAVPGLTVDRQCGGGLDAIVMACRLVQAGAGELYVAGGVESASTSPLRAGGGVDVGAGRRRFFPRNMFAGGGYDDPGMAESAEIVADDWGIDRAAQDAFAAESHTRAVRARDTGVFCDEIAPCPARAGGLVEHDSCPRPTITSERLARFPAIVRPGGSVTAGNASQIADGAGVVVVTTAERARRLGAAGLRFNDAATAGVDPRVCGIGAVAATRALVDRSRWLEPAAADHVAVTEAFASQVLATVQELGLDRERVNPDGGAIALGHPWGASGAIQVTRLFHALEAGQSGLALAAIAGGMGTAASFTREAT